VGLADGRCLIGHGHTRTAREDAVVSLDDAEALLIYDLRAIAAVIDEVILAPLSQNQVDALCAFAFSIGAEAFRHASVVRRINSGAYLDAAFALEIWRKADFDGERIVLDPLVRRRAAEKALFLTPDGGFIPSPGIAPKPDDGLPVPAVETPAEAPANHTDDEAPSPIEQAAANLAKRLQALAPEEAAAAPAPLTAPDPEAAPEPFQPHPQPPEEATGETAPFPEPALEEAPAEPAIHEPRAEQAERSLADLEAARRRIFGIPEPKPKLEIAGFWPLALLGSAGMALFVGAVIWAFRAKPNGAAAVASNAGVVVIGLVGIACVASAVYFLLERLSGREA
jgi:lysozyme